MNMAMDFPNVGAGDMRRQAVVAPRFGRLEVSTLQLIDWAFQREKVRLDFDEFEPDVAGFGMEYILIEQGRLGCRVQGGGSSPCHHDADMVAASLISLPEVYGGKRMAVYIADLARGGVSPNAMIGCCARCEPVEWKRTKHGLYGASEICRVLGLRWPSDQLGKKADGSWCPVSYSETVREVAAARRWYLDWYRAIHYLRYIFQQACHLTSFVVSDVLPPRAPWKAC